MFRGHGYPGLAESSATAEFLSFGAADAELYDYQQPYHIII